jgi:tetratricopeptide (TPR) repeat protein
VEWLKFMNYLQLFSITTVLIGTGFSELAIAELSSRLNPLLISSMLIAQNNSGEFEFQDFDFWINQCLLLSSQREYAEALAACEQAIALKPNRDNLNLWFARGHAPLRLEQYSESLASFQRVVEADLNDSEAIAPLVEMRSLSRCGFPVDRFWRSLMMSAPHPESRQVSL